MKVLCIKKTTILMLILIVLSMSVCIANNQALNLGSIFFNINTKKLPIYSVNTEENKVAISFDAAWGADKTREIMSVCKSYGVNATFFLVGFWVKEYPDMVLEIYNNGFEIGLHSNTHPDMTKLSIAKMREELEANRRLISDIIGVEPELFRPPFGYYNNDLINLCDSMGIQCIQWSVDSLDWKGLSAGELSGRVISRSKNGSIVLFHNNSDHIIDGLKMVLEHYKTQQTQVVPIGELIYKDNFVIDRQGMQVKT